MGIKIRRIFSVPDNIYPNIINLKHMERNDSLMKEHKRYYYKMFVSLLGNSESYIISSDKNLEETKMICLYLQNKAFNNITYDIPLNLKDIINLLVEYYGFRSGNLAKLDEKLYKFDLLDIWNEAGNLTDFSIDYENVRNSEAEYRLLDILNSYSEDFIFINANINLPKWGFEYPLEPLSLQVTYNGILISGIGMIDKKEREKLINFYDNIIFYDKQTIFFNFEYFPPYKYSFGWDGKNISICEVEEFQDQDARVLREMKIGYYLTSTYLNKINLELKEFEILRRKMRLM